MASSVKILIYSVFAIPATQSSTFFYGFFANAYGLDYNTLTGYGNG